MQTTLLGFAVAVILALVTALVGPLFIDWGRYRSTLESEAGRLIGMPVHIAGQIDARLLPTPYVIMQDIEIGTRGRGPSLRARALGLEFGLGSLIKGESRAAELHLDGPELEIGVDASGSLDAAPISVGFDPDQLSIERVRIENGRMLLRHGRTGATLTLEQVSFNGDVRSLMGPFKGEGAFVSSAERYRYRLAAGRRTAEGGTKLRLSIDPSDRPLALEAEGTVLVERGLPRFEGTISVARPVGTALSSGKTMVSEPWRATSRVKAGPNSTLFEQLEFQYGPDERSIRLTGTAEAKFAPRAQIDAVLSARQIDLDRSLGPSELPRRMPIAVMHGFFATVFDGWHPRFPIKLGIDIDAVTLGGATLQTVRGDLKSEADAWTIDTFEFRAPGLTQVKFGGRLTGAPKAFEFSGPASIRSTDPGTLVAWLEGRTDTKKATIGPLSGRGQLTIGSERIAVDNLNVEFDHKAIEGRFAYVFPQGQRPARLDAALSAAELDIESAISFGMTALAGTTFERPRDVALDLAIGKAHYAGIEARSAEANLKFDATGLLIERLAIADIGGAVVNASGRVDTSSASPRGALALGLEAQRLDGVAAIAASLFPQSAEAIRAYAGRLAPAKVAGRIDFEPDGGKPGSTAKLGIDGRLGPLRVNVTASGTSDVGAILPGKVTLSGQIDAEDGTAFAALSGLDRVVALDQRPANLVLALAGPAGDLRVDGQLAAGGLEATAIGSIRVALDGLKSDLDLSIAAADAVFLRHGGARPMPVAVKTKLSLAGPRVTLDEVRGHIAGTAVGGQLTLTLANPTRVEGRIEADDLDAAGVLAKMLGAPARAANRTPAWPVEPFTAGYLSDLVGHVDFALTKAMFTPGLVARKLQGQARFEPGAILFENLAGSLGEGRVSGQASIRRAAVGLSARAHLAIAKADLAALVPGARTPLAGRLSLEMDVEGSGLSPASLVGALQGNGALTVEQLQIAGLDPKAIDAAIRAVERGLPIERVTDFSNKALDGGALKIAWASGPITISNGRARVSDLSASTDATDVAFAAAFDLLDETLDARFTLTAPPRADAPGDRRPELSVLFKGPPQSLRRRTEAGALINWITLRNVEQETKRLEAAEREAKRLQAIEAARRAEQERLERERAERERIERERVAERERAERAERERVERERAEKERSASTSSPPTTSSTNAAAVGSRAPDLPPPVDIRPVPARPTRPAKPQPPAQAPAENAPLLRQMLNLFQ